MNRSTPSTSERRIVVDAMRAVWAALDRDDFEAVQRIREQLRATLRALRG